MRRKKKPIIVTIEMAENGTWEWSIEDRRLMPYQTFNSSNYFSGLPETLTDLTKSINDSPDSRWKRDFFDKSK